MTVTRGFGMVSPSNACGLLNLFAARSVSFEARQARLQQPHLDHQHTERRWERSAWIRAGWCVDFSLTLPN